MNINGVELDFNFMEAGQNRRSIEALKSIYADAEKVTKLPMADQIDGLCSTVKNAFDYVFGPGVGIQVCGRENDLLVCINAFTEFCQEKSRQEEMLRISTQKLLSITGDAG